MTRIKIIESHIKNIKIQIILDIVSNHYLLPQKCFYIESRKREIIRLRYVAIYFIYFLAKLNCVKIAEKFKKSHCTVVYVKKTVKNDIETSKTFREEIKQIEDKIIQEFELKKDLLLAENYTFENLNESIVVKIDTNKNIIFTGMSEDEVRINLMLMNKADCEIIDVLIKDNYLIKQNKTTDKL